MLIWLFEVHDDALSRRRLNWVVEIVAGFRVKAVVMETVNPLVKRTLRG